MIYLNCSDIENVSGGVLPLAAIAFADALGAAGTALGAGTAIHWAYNNWF